MTGRGGILPVLACCLWAGAALGQDRPPTVERPAAVPVEDSRPPERPETPDDLTPPEKTQATSPTTADKSAPEPTDTAAFIGPPAPPRSAELRESDQEYEACLLALSFLGTGFEPQSAVTDPKDRDCGIERPILVRHILPDLELEGGAVMRCETARALGFWARDFLRPAAATLPESPRVTGLRLGSTYDCRPRVGTGKEKPKLSEHALGTAIDIAAILFDRGEPLVIEPRVDTGDRTEAFQRAVRGAACLYFTTVLGPGSNDAHSDHLHFDLARRNHGWRLCQ